jgi:hypothetical protein
MVVERRDQHRRRMARVAGHLVAAGNTSEDTSVVPYGAQRGSGGSVDKSHGNHHDDFPAPGRPPPATAVPGYLAHTAPSEGQLAAWVEQFHTEGFLYLPKVSGWYGRSRRGRAGGCRGSMFIMPHPTLMHIRNL